ncbi:MAG: ferredoxin [Candidatus Methanoperedens sp.]
MTRFKIEIERPLCISCESCVNVCPGFWEMAEDGFSHLKGSKRVGGNEEREVDDAGCNIDAAEICPVICIHVYENGKKII